MSQHCCERCHYTTNLKANLIKHLNKKSICPSNYSQRTSKELLNELLQPKEHKCPYCNKTFSHVNSLYRHKQEKHNIDNHNAINNIDSHDTHNTNNITNNITIQVFGQEELKSILENDNLLLKC